MKITIVNVVVVTWKKNSASKTQKKGRAKSIFFGNAFTISFRDSISIQTNMEVFSNFY